MKTKTRILTVLLAIALSFTLFSLGSVSANTNNGDELDINGVPIAESIPTLAETLYEKLWTIDLPNESLYGTIIFMDSQLMAYNLVDMLCEVYCPGSGAGDDGLNALYETYRIEIFVHTSGWTFTSITEQALGGTNCVYDFADPDTYELLCDLVGQVAMCGMAILNTDYSLYTFLLHFQDLWGDRMPVYSIQRDPITLGAGGLKVYIVNYYAGSTGGATGGMVQIVPDV